MNINNKQFLDDKRHFYVTLVKAQTMRGLSHEDRQNMQRIMGEEFRPAYATDLNCTPCVFEMVATLYREYDKWIAAQPVGEAIKVAANFPSHKNHHRR